MQTKPCRKCGITKPLDGFRRDKNRDDGREADCKACARDYERIRYKEGRDNLQVGGEIDFVKDTLRHMELIKHRDRVQADLAKLNVRQDIETANDNFNLMI